MLFRFRNYSQLDHLISSIVLFATLSLYYALQHFNKELTFNYLDRKIEYKYSTLFHLARSKSYKVSEITYKMYEKATRTGRQKEVIILKGSKEIVSINNKEDEFSEIDELCEEFDNLRNEIG